MRFKHAFLMLAIGILTIPTMSSGQFPGMPGGGGGMPGGGGFGGMKMDPDALFNMVSKGKDTINVAEMDPFSKSMYDRFASRFGFTGNVITRDMFKEGLTKAREVMAQGGMGAMMPGGGAGGPPQFSGQPGADRLVEERFKRYDRNEDGVLQYDELPERMQGERDKYDTNKDGMIDLTEYKAYVNDFMNAANGGRDIGPGGLMGGMMIPGGGRPVDEEEKRPTVYRSGNLPKDLPTWFSEVDGKGDLDGQVGLYEWKNSGKSIEEFITLDLNSDGFVTVEEYYRYKKTQSGGGSTLTAAQILAGNFGPGNNSGRPGSGGGDRGSTPGGPGGPPNMMAMGAPGGFPGMGGPGMGGLGGGERPDRKGGNMMMGGPGGGGERPDRKGGNMMMGGPGGSGERPDRKGGGMGGPGGGGERPDRKGGGMTMPGVTGGMPTMPGGGRMMIPGGGTPGLASPGTMPEMKEGVIRVRGAGGPGGPGAGGPGGAGGGRQRPGGKN